MLDLYIDIDAHAVYSQALRVAQRHSLELYVVTKDYLHGDPTVHLIAAQEDQASGSAWIIGNITRGDICVTGDPGLALNCLVLGALALSPTGRQWSGRDVDGDTKGSVEPWSPDARTFVQRLEQAIASTRVVGPRSFTSPRDLSRPGLIDRHQGVPTSRLAFA